MDGNYNAGVARETVRQGEITKHDILRVNLSLTGLLNPGDASSAAAASPLLDDEAGPHFVLPSTTPDNSHCYGFTFCLSDLLIRGSELSAPAAGGYTVTIWELIGTSVINDKSVTVTPIWAKFTPRTGVGFHERYHTFDVNATAIKFQIENQLGGDDISGSLFICLSPL